MRDLEVCQCVVTERMCADSGRIYASNVQKYTFRKYNVQVYAIVFTKHSHCAGFMDFMRGPVPLMNPGGYRRKP